MKCLLSIDFVRYFQSYLNSHNNPGRQSPIFTDRERETQVSNLSKLIYLNEEREV